MSFKNLNCITAQAKNHTIICTATKLKSTDKKAKNCTKLSLQCIHYTPTTIGNS